MHAQKALITASASFLMAITKVTLLEERLDTVLYLPPICNIFLIFPYCVRSNS